MERATVDDVLRLVNRLEKENATLLQQSADFAVEKQKRIATLDAENAKLRQKVSDAEYQQTKGSGLGSPIDWEAEHKDRVARETSQ
jgi:uncharacterized protein (UPF0335 family)